MAKIKIWVEPAHSGVIKLYDDLVSIYSVIREKAQADIDKAFDQVSRQVGFVVATAVPVVVKVGDNGTITDIDVEADHLKGTLFENALSGAFRSLKGTVLGAQDSDADTDSPASAARKPARAKKVAPKPAATGPAGVYKLYLFWSDALKLKLRTDWMEPAHLRVRDDLISKRQMILEEEELARAKVIPKKPDPGDPPQWFDPGTLIVAEERVLISAIDEVYPEFRLADRVTATRQIAWDGIREPAQFSLKSLEQNPAQVGEMLSELSAVLRKYGY